MYKTKMIKNSWLFDWSDRTNLDEKLTLMDLNLQQVRSCDQRSICDSKPDGQFNNFWRVRQDQSGWNKSPLYFKPCSGSKLNLNMILGQRQSLIFWMVRQDQSIMSSNLAQVQICDQRSIQVGLTPFSALDYLGC